MNEPVSPSEKPAEMTPFEILISSPEVRKAIAETTEIIREYIRIKARWITAPTIILILTLIFIVVGAVTFLAYSGKLSSDAVSFLLGTVVGASFTFIQKFFPGR